MYEVGQLVRIRDRIWQVIEDHPPYTGHDHTLRVLGIDTDVRGREHLFIYRPVSADGTGSDSGEPEDYGLEKVTPLDAPELLWKPSTPPSQWARLHTAYKLSIAHGAGYLLGLWRSRLVVEPYQLAPVLRVMSAPQQRFLLAEDVGMGKTIEAGLIMMELIARGRGDRILIVVPAALQDQWKDELHDKFGLDDFRVVDSDYLTKELIPNLPSGANPWNYANRVITSIDFAKQPRILPALKKTRWNLIIVDEAHYMAESGTDTKPTPTSRSRFGEAIAPLCDSLLLLTATPHDGYAQGFFSLLRLLDDTRFASPNDLRRETIEQVMIRRSKSHIFNKDRTLKFQLRTIHHRTLSLNDLDMKDERRLYKDLTTYVSKHWRAARNNPADRATVGFAMTLLKKRLISSVGAIQKSLQTRLTNLTNESVDPTSEQEAYQYGVPLTEPQRERVENRMVVYTKEHDLEKERNKLRNLLKRAEAITPEKDHKLMLLKNLLDDLCSIQKRKVIVFTEYKDTLDYIYGYLSNNGYSGRIAVLHGHLNRQARLAVERMFHQEDTAILLATDAASEGLNFQHGCWTIIHNELPWNPNRLEQRNGRVDRWGQTHPIEVYNLIFTDTLEGDILARLQEKLDTIRLQLGSVSDVLSITGPLDLDTFLMDGGIDHTRKGKQSFDDDDDDEDEEIQLPQALDTVQHLVDKALAEGQEALDACRAQFLIAPGAFTPDEYAKIEAIEQQTKSVLPSPAELEEFVESTLRELGGRATRIDLSPEFVERLLKTQGNNATHIEGELPHLWTLGVPHRLGVQHHYERATFEREVALLDSERPPAIEYLGLGHPLLEALVAAVKSDARVGSGKGLAGRMSIRVLQSVPRGFLFTYLARWQDKRGAVAAEEIIPIFLCLDGSTLPPEETQAMLQTPGLRLNVPPELLHTVYEPLWPSMREQAQTIATERSAQRAAEITHERQPQLDILRRDIDVWARARTQWIERAIEQRYTAIQQALLFETKEERDRRRAQETAAKRQQNDLKHERAAIQMRREKREREIDEMSQIILLPPEVIGALVIVPAEEC